MASKLNNGGISRRQALLLLGSTLCAPASLARETRNEQPVTPFARVVPGYRLQFPRDEGSHPDFRLEWWYITGWLEGAGKPLGFQITFFRARPQLKHDNPSAFTPRQIMIAHAALSDPAHGRLMHAQRAARAGFGLAGAEPGRTRVWMDDWSLQQEENSYRARIPAQEFSLEIEAVATQPPLLQGEDGFSRKGPAPESASYYYSIPHLKVSGTVARGGARHRVTGTAWMDHEWSSQYLEKNAAGWDWIGINFDDGAALMAFRMRDRQGGHFWAGGALRQLDGRLKVFSPEEVRFIPRREWKSARTGTSYPVSFTVRAGDREFAIEPLFDDQEHDTRASTGTIYWEGAVRASSEGKPVGSGYLELTGYWRRVNL
jgi:predicted secreted hydrolase